MRFIFGSIGRRDRGGNPFDAPPPGVGFAYFRGESLKNHLDTLSATEIGRTLEALRLQKNIPIKTDQPFARPGTAAQYVYDFSRVDDPGTIDVGPTVHAGFLGHELRHAWQRFVLPVAAPAPASPEEFIIYQRFMEADARAVEFGVLVQTVGALRIDNPYAWNLVAGMDDFQKDICRRDVGFLDRMAQDPALLKQAMRDAFDEWMTYCHVQPRYEDNIIKTLWSGLGAYSLGVVFEAAGRTDRLALTRRGVDPAFIPALAVALGVLGSNGDYLTSTVGPAFADPFYTRICNYQLEKVVDDCILDPS